MATGKLTAIEVKAAMTPGRYGDGGGLMLLVKPDARRSWILRLRTAGGSRRDFGLGGYPDVSLAGARAKAAAMRDQVRGGVDPRSPDVDPVARARADAKATKAEAAKAKATRSPIANADDRSFAAVARRLHSEIVPTFRAPKHAAQWLTRLETYAFPAIGAAHVDTITGPMVIDVLAPVWLIKPETARRVRQLIAATLDYAHAKGWRTTPAPTPTMLAKGLPAQPERDGHFAAVDYSDAPHVLARLRSAPESTGRLALLFTILTAARSGETRGATWGEVDLAEAVWRVPGERMKMRRAHNVPLSPAALGILARAAAMRMRPDDPGELIFPGAQRKPLSDMTMSKAQRLAAPDTTVHGWRSTFRDWVAETTEFGADLAEAALAHAIGDATRRAYERGDKLEKRRALMDAWAAYVDPLPEGVARLTPRSRGRVAA